nr:MAG TPA: hypothetical protein [Caudoviricetes sp.]
MNLFANFYCFQVFLIYLIFLIDLNHDNMQFQL